MTAIKNNKMHNTKLIQPKLHKAGLKKIYYCAKKRSQTLGQAGHSCSAPKESLKLERLSMMLFKNLNSPKHSPTRIL